MKKGISFTSANTMFYQIKHGLRKISDLVLQEHHLIRKNQIYYMNRFNTREEILTSFEDSKFSFHFHILLHKLFLLLARKRFFRFVNIDPSLCSFWKMEEEIPLHLFYGCTKEKNLWN